MRRRDCPAIVAPYTDTPARAFLQQLGHQVLVVPARAAASLPVHPRPGSEPARFYGLPATHRMEGFHRLGDCPSAGEPVSFEPGDPALLSDLGGDTPQHHGPLAIGRLKLVGIPAADALSTRGITHRNQLRACLTIYSDKLERRFLLP